MRGFSMTNNAEPARDALVASSSTTRQAICHYPGQPAQYSQRQTHSAVSSPSRFPPVLAASIEASIQNASCLNRHGIAALASDDLASALPSFRNALLLLEQVEPYLVQACSAPINLEVLGATTLVATPGPQLDAIELANFQDDYIYLFSNAIDFLPDLQHQPEPSTSVAAAKDRYTFQVFFYSAVISFNIAVCLHRRGNWYHDEDLLVAAVHIYDNAMAAISNIPVAHFSDKLMLVMLAIWNNQSQIYYRLGSYSLAKQILEGVRTLSARLLVERRSNLAEDDQEHIFEFVLNVITMREPHAAPCA